MLVIVVRASYLCCDGLADEGAAFHGGVAGGISSVREELPRMKRLNSDYTLGKIRIRVNGVLALWHLMIQRFPLSAARAWLQTA